MHSSLSGMKDTTDNWHATTKGSEDFLQQTSKNDGGTVEQWAKNTLVNN